MTNLSNLKNEIKLDSIKTFFAVTIIAILGWGVSSSAIDDIKSATINFNAMGIVSEISDKSMTIKDAKGSNSASDTTYDLNLDYLSKIETSSYTPLNHSDVKVGNRIIVQGLTNNSTFFIKRIISFDSIATPVEEKDDTVLATTTIDDVVIATTTDVGTSTLTEDVIKESTGGSSSDTTPVTQAPVDTVIVSTTTEPVATTTSTSTDPVATTTSDVSTTTEGIIDTITSTIGDVIDKVVDVVQDVVETVVGSSTPEVVTEPAVNVQELIDNTVPLSDQQQ